MRDRRKGFAKFIREVDPANSTQSARPEIPWSKEDLLSTRLVLAGGDSLHRALGGDFRELNHAFVWSSSPQGHNYWSHRHYSSEPMSDEDYEFLRQLLEVHS